MTLRRSRTQWRLLLVATAVAVLACTLVASLGVLVAASEQSAVRSALGAVAPTDSAVEVTLSTPSVSVEEGSDLANAAIAGVLGLDEVSATTMAISEISIVPRVGALYRLVYFGEYDDLADHVVLTAGEWPTDVQTEGPRAVAVPESALTVLGLKVGGTVEIADGPGQPKSTLTIVGSYSVNDAREPYWRADLLGGATHDPAYPVPNAGGALSTDAVGPLIAAPGTFDAAGVAVDRLVVSQVPSFAAVTVDDLAPLVDRLSTAPGDVPVELGTIAKSSSYRSGLGAVVSSVASALAVTRSTVVVISLLLLVLAVAALTQNARLLTEARDGERSLMRARGASGRQLVALAALEAGVIAVLTAVVSPLLARLVYILLAQQPAMVAAGMTLEPGLPPLTILTAAAVALLFAAVLIAPLLRGAGSGNEGRQKRATAAQRSGIDIALVLLAGVAYWQLLSYRSPVGQGASLGVDPVLAVGPALALLAGALMCVRLVPVASRLAERVAARARGAVVPLAAWEVGRRPQRATAAVLLLTLALAVGTFSQAFLATWRQSQVDQAAFAVGAPVRVNPTDETPGFVAPPAGSDPAEPVYRAEGLVAGPFAQGDYTGPPDGDPAVILAVSGHGRDLLAEGRNAAEGGSVIQKSLSEATQPSEGADLAADAVGLTAIVRVTSVEHLAEVARVRVRAILEHENGALSTLALGSIRVDGVEERLSALLPEGGGPVRLVGLQGVVYIENTLLNTTNPQTDAALMLKDVSALTAGGDDLELDDESYGTTPVEVDDRQWLAYGDERANLFLVVPNHGKSWQLGLEFTVPRDLQSGEISVVEFGWQTVLRTAAVIDSALADKTNSEVGDTLSIVVRGVILTIEIEGVTPVIPGGGGTERFSALTVGRTAVGAVTTVVVDQGAIARALAQAGIADTAVTEWWVDVPPGGGEAYVAALPDDFTGQGGESLGRDMQEHPLRVATQAALWLVIAGAAALAAIGFAVHATGSLRSRAIEFAQLRAIGLSRRRLVGVVTAESALLTLFGTVFGIGLGVLLGILVAPLVGASADGSEPLPSVRVQIPMADIALLALEVAVVLALVVIVVARVQRAADPATVLRRGEER